MNHHFEARGLLGAVCALGLLGAACAPVDGAEEGFSEDEEFAEADDTGDSLGATRLALVAEGTDEDYLLMPPSGQALPENCAFGRARPANVTEVEVSLDDLQNAYDATVRLYGDASNGGGRTYKDMGTDAATVAKMGDSLASLWDNSRYLRIEAPSFMVQGRSHRIKANMLDPYAYAKFYTSESGYVGKDKSNLEANAYRHVTFERELGAAVVWTARGGLCSAKGVWVQTEPKITGGRMLNQDVTGHLEVTYEFSTYSRAGRSDEGATIRVYTHRNELVATKTVRDLSGKVTLYPSSYVVSEGTVTFYAQVDDGTYKSERVKIGTYTKKCDGKGYSWTYQPSPGSSNFQNHCGVDASGKQCPYTMQAMGSYSYPPIKVTCT